MNMRFGIRLISIFFIIILIQIKYPIVIGFNLSSNIDTTSWENIHINYKYYENSYSLEFNLKKQLPSFFPNNEGDKIIFPSNSIITNSDDSTNSSWPMMCYDTHHTSRSPYSTVNVTGLEKWRFRCGGVEGGIVIDDDGTILYGDKDNDIYALYPNGTLKWKYHTDMWITSTPALAEDGTLYVTSWDKKLWAFNSENGNVKWKFNTNYIIATSSPIIGEAGTIYFGTASGNTIFAVNPNGTEQWRYKVGSDIYSSPAIGKDGTIYIGSWDTYCYALNPNGTLKWRFRTGHYIKGPPSIADDGTIYIGSWDDYLYALYPTNGTMKWKCKVGSGTETNPSIAEDGTIYLGGDKLWAINPDGTKKWTFDLGEGRHIHKSCPAISADGTIYVGTNIWEISGGDIIALNPDGTEKWRKRISDKGWIDSSPTIAEDGTVYIGSQSDIAKGYLHAFGPVESNEPPETPTISGEANGNINEDYRYKIKSIDPDNNPVSFYIDWGDGDEGWTLDRASGETDSFEHRWNRKGNYTIRVKAKDTLGEESDWATLEVTMPKNKVIYYNFPMLNWLFEQFPNAFPILRQILGI